MYYFLIFPAFSVLLILSKRYYILKSITIILLLIAVSIWLFSDFYTGDGINEAVIYTLFTSEISQDVPIYVDRTNLLVVLLSAFFIFISLFISFKLKRNSYLFDLAFVFVLLTFLSLSKPMQNIINLIHTNKVSLANKRYIVDDNINKSIKGNYIFIIAESLERTFMDINGDNHLKKISSLDNKIDFSNIGYVTGSGWTIAGHVNLMCGLPLIGTGNDASKLDIFLPKAECFPDILKNSNYKNIYLSGTDASFSGMRAFLKTHSFDEIIEKKTFNKNELSKEQLNSWGIDDQVIFDYAIDIFNKESSSGNKFSLYISTINTHTPGYPSASCEKKNDSLYLNSIDCADETIYNFIKKIQSSEYYKNTTIVLVSDHGLMGWDKIIGTESKRSNLFMVFKDGIESKEIDTYGTVLDQLPTALEVASGEEISLGFGRGIFNSSSSLGKLDAEDIDFARSMWVFPKINLAKYNGDKEMLIGGMSFKLPACISYNDDMEIRSFSGNYSGCRKSIDNKEKGNFFLAVECDKKMCSEIYESKKGISFKTDSDTPFKAH
ncbi:hypothetical protein CHI96_15130 [Proteus mirabilis]|uniref:sulfatase-like hydrolase/transferase n=1 Tax=Proteus mirabilis TaxID=584 RepID=UPI000B9FE54E|nr:sulfatase-like hydrolase/transferase [Proteus mirabilis]OZS65365.1 hypothetical protein CHI96_15130 [Proteus mirabilis]HAU5009074.1 sulfatase-like hydrolase/transferase [Proteus mirabilis]HBC5640036.1 sulfatase-like hydrolase/transferase [Proteus mirabilis]HBC5645461.1 sulfatase-like hydrolase/transferase [Proteus mirabilis]